MPVDILLCPKELCSSLRLANPAIGEVIWRKHGDRRSTTFDESADLSREDMIKVVACPIALRRYHVKQHLGTSAMSATLPHGLLPRYRGCSPVNARSRPIVV